MAKYVPIYNELPGKDVTKKQLPNGIFRLIVLMVAHEVVADAHECHFIKGGIFGKY